MRRRGSVGGWVGLDIRWAVVGSGDEDKVGVPMEVSGKSEQKVWIAAAGFGQAGRRQELLAGAEDEGRGRERLAEGREVGESLLR